MVTVKVPVKVPIRKLSRDLGDGTLETGPWRRDLGDGTLETGPWRQDLGDGVLYTPPAAPHQNENDIPVRLYTECWLAPHKYVNNLPVFNIKIQLSSKLEI